MTRLDSVPPPGLVLLGILSVQLGAGFAKNLFEELPPSAVVTLRLATSAVVLVVVSRKLLAGARLWSGKDWAVAAGFGLTLAAMNASIYESFARIPLGIAVTIEFLGPLGVAIAYSRRRLDVVWVLLAAGGVMLLTRGASGTLTAAGVAFALLAATAWAAYILLSVETGRRLRGSSGLAVASTVGTPLVFPFGVASGGADLLRPDLLPLGAGFGALRTPEPAVAAVVGVVVVGEILRAREWVAIGCVVVPCIGATRTRAVATRTRAVATPEAPEV